MISLAPAVVAHRLDRLRRRADEDEARILAGLHEPLVLSEEAVAGMHGIRAADLCRGNDGGDVEIGLRRQRFADAHGLVGLPHMKRIAIGVGIDRDDTKSESPRTAHHAQRDLAAVGDQDLEERPVLH
ncbi:hypothetical protein ACVWXO_002872 [Bradyrhizobium sp. LM2.7]